MNVKNCRSCRRLFNYVYGPPICPACREAKEEKFQQVKKYIQENRGATVTQVAEECEVDAKQINQWIREERLQFADDSPIRVTCEKCGAMIRAGVFCEKCKLDMANELGAAYKTETPPPAPEKKKSTADRDKMRFL